MKKYIYLCLCTILLCTWSCKKNSTLTNTLENKRHCLPAYEYSDEEGYSYLYNQIYEIIETMDEDASLTELIDGDSLYEDFNIEDINCGRISEVSNTYSYQALDDVVYNFYGLHIDELESSSGVLNEIIPEILTWDYIPSARLYEILHQYGLTESEAVLLYTVCAAHNYHIEESSICHILLDDGGMKRLEVYPKSSFPSLLYTNSVLHIHVDNVFDWDYEEIPNHISDDLYMVDTIRFESFTMMNEYFAIGLTSGEIYYTTAEECREAYYAECASIVDSYNRTIMSIANSGMDQANMMIHSVYAFAYMESKLEVAELQLVYCLRTATENND